jgi:hypothetical protein
MKINSKILLAYWKALLALVLAVWLITAAQTTLITAFVVVGALFYVSHTTEHRWIRRFRRMDPSTQDTKPVAVVGGTDSQGRALRSRDYREDR